jgi:hypothetical protein
MRFLALVLTIIAGIIGGFTATYAVIRHGISFDQQKKGAWEFVARAGAPEIDPYRRARVFVEGELPLAAGEGFSLRAARDSRGEALDGRCIYRIAGAMPAARFWTLTLSARDGRLLPHPTGRSGFTSAEIIRPGDGAVVIDIGADPLAGNWLPAPREGGFVLVFRFYETPLSATATLLDPAAVPMIERVRCRA